MLGPTKVVSAVIVPILAAAFVILYLFPGRSMRLWSWMVCPEMSAMIMGGGYLSGAYFFARVTREKQWHRVGAGFVATTVFASVLLLVTVLHWEMFNHDHVSFWAWLLLYASTPFLLPWLWAVNRRTDPRTVEPGDAAVPPSLAIAVGLGGVVQLGVAAIMFLRPSALVQSWPWVLDEATLRSLSAFVAFPAVTWLWFFFERRWSSFRVTQQVVTLGLALIGIAAIVNRAEFRDGRFGPYVAMLGVSLVLNVALYRAMERRARSSRAEDYLATDRWYALTASGAQTTTMATIQMSE
ncbi:MAG: hypothetical protein ACRD12_17800 [Acidimicrobiales bacterium]